MDMHDNTLPTHDSIHVSDDMFKLKQGVVTWKTYHVFQERT